MQGVFMTSRSLAAKAFCVVAVLFMAGQCAAQPPSAKKAAGKAENPFAHREQAPEFPQDVSWFNTKKPLKKEDLKGKFVLLDFWTYCCINCMHILPELKKLEHAHPNNLVVIGVHSGKFDAEHDVENIRKGILRNEIEHPVINDADYALWNHFGIDTWP